MKLSMANIFIDFDQGLCDQRIHDVHYVHDILSVLWPGVLRTRTQSLSQKLDSLRMYFIDRPWVPESRDACTFHGLYESYMLVKVAELAIVST